MKFNLKKATLTFLMLVITIAIYSQEQRTCGTDVRHEEKMQDQGFAERFKKRNRKFKEELTRVKSNDYQAKMATLIIPVAVHFPEGSEAQRPCLEALAQSQVDVLNQDYTATNADISNWAAASGFYPGTNTAAFDVEFILATRNHPADTDDDLVEGGPAVSIGYNYGNGNDADIKWAGYKNFLVKTIAGGILGYSPLGGSIANGAAVVMAPFAFGSDAIAPGCSSNGIDYVPGAPYNLGRTVTHELGHYFTLNHTFQGGCAGNNDGYNDTPAIAAPNYGCPADGSVDACVAGEKALTMNYMDYVNDACMWMLSQDQVDAMTAYWNVVAGDLNTDVVTTDYSLNFASTDLSVCDNEVMEYTFDYVADGSFSTQVDFTFTVVPAGPIVTFSQQNATTDTTGITATVTGATTGNYTVTVTGTYGAEVQNYNLTLDVYSGTPNLPVLTTPADGAVSVSDYTLVWPVDANAVTYEVEIATDAGFGNIVVGPVSVNTNQYVAVGLSPLTEYFWRVKAINSCATTATSVPFSFTTDVCTVCTSVANTDYATSTTRVVFNTIDNASGKPSGYSDYTAISTDVNINSSYDLTVNANTDGAYTTKTIVWIDWNQNCVFDVPSEEYDLGDAFDTADGATDLSVLSITVPAGAVLGSTIMRVTTKFKADGLQTSCENGADAEVEDYTINVLVSVPDYSVTATNSPITLCNSATSAVFNYDFTVINGYSTNTTFAVTSVLPAGANAIFSPTSMDADGTFTMTVTGLTNFPAGDNTIEVTATGTNVKTVDVVLNITAGVTGAPSLTTPADNAVGIALPSVALTWVAVTGATSYTVETATDIGFTVNTTSNVVTIPTYDFGGLIGATQYFWRVLTTNICGDSVYSSIYNFTAVSDTDNDGILDDVDNCVNTPNPDQADIDGNGIGDVCQDTDGDGVLDINDNCPTEANTDQADVDGNGIGDACQDTDSDGVLDINDNCPLTANTNQEDANNDGIGDICESVEPADTLTPNGDLQNDTWNIKNIEYVNNNTVKVFNRHGVKVFDASNYVNNTWGGESTEGGSGLLPAGSYYYVIEYTSSQGEAKVTKGWMYINY